jgi:hypothetical protein
METSNELTGPTLFDPTLFAADTPANHSQPQENEPAKTTPATSGRGYEKPYATYDPATQSWKMFGDISLWEEPESLAKLPPSGMTRSGELFLRPPWEPITAATESSLLHTPTGKMNQMSPSMADGKRQSGWWPTPTTQEVEHPDAELNEKGRRVSKDGKNSHSVGLADAVQFWPTPTADESRNAYSTTSAFGNLRTAVGASPETGKLNPTWVEWLMGFPLGWTDLKDSETPSSPK